jgi:hypothetical protein
MDQGFAGESATLSGFWTEHALEARTNELDTNHPLAPRLCLADVHHPPLSFEIRLLATRRCSLQRDSNL